MPRSIYTQGKIVICLAGRYAGRKAVVLRSFDQGNKSTNGVPSAIVAGLTVAPKTVTKSMSEKKRAARSQMKAFVKSVNYTHLMPTRRSLKDVKAVNLDDMKTAEGRAEVSKNLTTYFTDLHKKDEEVAKWFFAKLRF